MKRRGFLAACVGVLMAPLAAFGAKKPSANAVGFDLKANTGEFVSVPKDALLRWYRESVRANEERYEDILAAGG